MNVSIVAPARNRRSLEVLLGCLSALDALFLETHPDIPALYDGGVIYQREPPGVERWLTIPYVIERGYGDCKMLAAWRAAELVVRGNEPAARAVIYEVRPGKWHVVVRRGDGSIEDPSRILGMGQV